MRDRSAAWEAKDEFVEKQLIPVILELCAVGSKVPIEPSYDDVAMRRCLQMEVNTP